MSFLFGLLRHILTCTFFAVAIIGSHAQVRDLERSVESLAQDAAGYFQEELDRRAFHARIALVEVEYTANPQYADIMNGIADRLYHHLTRLQRVDGNEIFKVVERTKVEDVWAEQKASCGADRDEGCMIELGKNLSANRLVFVRVAKELDPRKDWHEAILTIVDATNGQRLMSYDADIHFDDRMAPIQPQRQTTTSTYKPPKDPKNWSSDFDLRLGGAYENYFNNYRPSGFLEALYRSEKAGIGVRLGYMPGVIDMNEVPYDIGHLVGVQTSDGVEAVDKVVFAGDVPMYARELVLLPTAGTPLSFDSLTSATDEGITGFEFDRIRMSNVQASRFSGHALLRLYLSQNVKARKRVKLYVDLGLGYDWIRTSAKFSVERTRLTQADFTYTTTLTQSTPSAYEYDGYKKDLLLGTLMFGAGLEYGRVSVSFNWRTVWNTAFGDSQAGYRRVKGDILYMPMLNERDSSTDAIRLALEDDGAVKYGRVNIQPDSKNKYSGNGVNRFTDRSNLMFNLAIRIL